MATFGKLTDGSGSSSSGANRKRVSQATPGSNGTVTAGTIRMWRDSGSAPVKMVIYADSTGNPGALLAVSDEISLIATAEGDVNFTFSGANQISVVGSTPYWIGYHNGTLTGGSFVSISSDSTASGHRNDTDTYSDGTSDPYGTPTATSGIIDAYITYTEGGGATDVFFENKYGIEGGMKAATAAGMNGVLVT